MSDTSDTSAILAARMRHKVTLATRATSNTSATQAQHECYANDTSATRMLHERHECDTSEKF